MMEGRPDKKPDKYDSKDRVSHNTTGEYEEENGNGVGHL